MMGEVLQTLTGNLQHIQTWLVQFSKILDIEYQTYGWVWAKKKMKFILLGTCCRKKAVRISFDRESRNFLGINTFGTHAS
jgi:hypothetical protein